jgi:peptide/nickel transport system substrate-binding protein
LTLYALGVSGCFIMPERVAKTDPFKQITDSTGSGPFKFIKDEWVAGARAVWVKNDKYIPRDEKTDFFAGGKHVYVDRVAHTVMPHGATAAAALQKLGACALDRSGADAVEVSGRDRRGIRSAGLARYHPPEFPLSAVRQS